MTIKDRLRVLQPNDPDSYYAKRELVPPDMLADLERAKIVITNYHAFKLRDLLELSKGGRSLLQGRGDELKTIETEGQMIQRVMPELMGLKNILVINDEAHHCYREKPSDSDDEALKGEERKEAEQNSEAARLWITGLEMVNRKLGLLRVMDLSATPFFLSGSGYAEGTLFPWTMCDFSLMDAIECGIVKLPRVPVADNIPGEEMPRFRNLWENIRSRMPKKGRGKAAFLDPLDLPVELQTALQALYGHYEKTYKLWEDAKIKVPPCFIVVCNNTSTSKLVYDYISGFQRPNDDGTTSLQNGALPLFRNFNEHGDPLARPRTLLIDSEQLESGEALDDQFRKAAGDEIERFRREIVERTGNQQDAENLTDQDLLREVMNTVGKEDRLGEQIRCVVSVSMLTEGWDANTVTHVLGVRAFGTQLLCEQVIGRALRRQSYELNEETPPLFNVEYADVLGIPFDFTAKPVVAPPQPPRMTIQVKAVRPGRDSLEIRFPRVAGYRVELPDEKLTAKFTADSTLELTPEIVGPSITRVEGIIGEGVNLDLAHLKDLRPSALLYNITHRLLTTKWRDPGEEPKLHLFGQLKRIAREWLENHLVCTGGAYPAQLMYQELADIACERITAAIVADLQDQRPIKVIPDSYNPIGSTNHVNFNTSKTLRWQTAANRCHINWVILDSGWEGEFCRIYEKLAWAVVPSKCCPKEIANELGDVQEGTLRAWFPELCRSVSSKRDNYKNEVCEIELKRALIEIPVPSLNEVARRSGQTIAIVKERAPDLCRRLQALRKSTALCGDEGLYRRTFPFLSEDPPPTGAEVCRRLGISWRSFRSQLPELSQKIKERARAHRNEKSIHGKMSTFEETRRAVQQLYSNGEYPTAAGIAAMLTKKGQDWALLNDARKTALAELKRPLDSDKNAIERKASTSERTLRYVEKTSGVG